MTSPRLAIIVPCFNEQEVLPDTLRVLGDLRARMIAMNLISSESYLLFVDDCSSDATWEMVRRANSSDKSVRGISLMANAGQQPAMICGLEIASDDADCAVTIDADLQDDPEAIIEMVKKFVGGADIVYGVRARRDSDTWFKRTSAHLFYRIQRAMGVKVLYDHSEFRLMSRRAINMLKRYDERNMFLRGVVQSLGLPYDIVYFTRNPRLAGETKYNFSKLLALSIDGVTSFTSRPMRMIFALGIIIVFLDIIVGIWALTSYLTHRTVTGWTSLILSVWLLGGLILMSLGVVGEYIGKIFLEVKHRPRFHVREYLK
ncbi:MAG: glycosyltransferase family 2 protein [Muribaculaceae bacterium]|nr:glycosyltransferase family 2 protein [Muribaculaceae bacterium]